MSENYGTECVFLFFVLFVCFSVFKILSVPVVTIKSRQKCLTDIFNLDLVIKTGNCWCKDSFLFLVLTLSILLSFSLSGT